MRSGFRALPISLVGGLTLLIVSWLVTGSIIDAIGWLGIAGVIAGITWAVVMPINAETGTML